jgi:hypothetical protein
MLSTLRFTGLALLAFALSTAARAETTNCTVIPALNLTISAPGIYCLNSSLSGGGNGIIIDSSDVVVDLNGHAITGTGHSFGVRSSPANHNVTVRNGTIRGYERGVSLGTGGDAALIEDLRVEGNTRIGIIAPGRAAVVRRNQVLNNGLPTGIGGARYGIAVEGPGSHVTDNEVVEIGVGTGSEVNGIRVAFGSGTVVQRNVVSNSAAAGFMSRGILFESSTGVAAIGNRISGMAVGIDFSDSNGIYMDNTVGGAATPFSGGTAAGRTNFSF